MATFRNVSGVSLDLMLPDWYASKTVEAGDTVDVEDDLAAKYNFDQPGVWERADNPAPPVQPVAVSATDEGK